MEMKVLLIYLVIIAFVDIKKFKIPNACILAGTITGILMTILLGQKTFILLQLKNMFLIFVLLYPFFLIKGLGAGDIKLLMMSAFYMKSDELFKYIALTIIIAGVISIVKMIIYKESRERLKYLIAYICKTAMTISAGVVDKYEISYSEDLEIRAKSVIRLSVPALISTLIIILK